MRALAQRLEGLDALGSSGMTRQNTAAIAVAAQQPSQGVSHRLFGIARASEQGHCVAIGLQLEGSAVTVADQSPRDRRDGAAAGENFFQQSYAETDPDPDYLSFSWMAEIFVSDFMGQNPAQLIVVRLA